ncbi:two pore channel protein 2-like isoform X2 [Engraulis encrasicolus]|uniref:two pore channel protein 2-like isoform X2 n=1 Tax=Engraulis encrasicolus TaxID=184585 RepID=UPI002FD0004C
MEEAEPLLSSNSGNLPDDYGSQYRGLRDHSNSDAGEEDEVSIQQAVVFLEDAIEYRSINHRVDVQSLKLYRWYYSKLWQWGLGATIAVILSLAFLEKPSSLSRSSDPRVKALPWEPPCGVTESIEMLCLCVFILDFSVKSYLIGWHEFWKTKWLIGYIFVIVTSIIDWTLSLSMLCNETFRVRRVIRPFFLLQNSSLMKKTLKCLKRTVPEMASVILLLALHLCLFTMFGMLLFAKTENPKYNGEWENYFTDLPKSLSSLLVLLTTANNPDVMIPAYSLHRGYSIFFILFSVFGTYFLMNLITAIIYNQFRGYLLMSIQTSIYRRRLGIHAAFAVLSCQGQHSKSPTGTEENVQRETLLKVLEKMQMKSYYKETIIKKMPADSLIKGQTFQMLFDELDKDQIKEHPPKPEYHHYFLQRLQEISGHYFVTVLGNAVALANVMCICTVLVLDSEKAVTERDDYLEIINCVFILFYCLEMGLKIFTLGWKRYLSYKSNIFDGLSTILLLIIQIAIFSAYKLPLCRGKEKSHGFVPLWEMVRLINMLIVLRFLRIVVDIKVVYYVYAVLGIWLFQGVISPPTHKSLSNSSMEIISANVSMECGTYEQLEYWPNNFDDFASSLILLYNIMVVNNWHVFTEAFARYTTEWSKVYFVSWWLISSVVWVNLFIALILENFTYRWDHSHAFSVIDVERTAYQTSVQLMFREHVQQPTEDELMTSLQQHPYLHLRSQRANVL